MCCFLSAEVSEQKQLCWGVRHSPVCQPTGPRGTSGAMETTEVPLAGFGVKAALPFSHLERTPGCWSMFFTHI